jgi:hypothetical protein
VNLGHSGNPCSALPESQKILVVADSGQHTVQVRFCKCSKNGFLENFRQLLRLRLYPASAHSPKTVSTFDFLDTYHKISLQGKLNLYDFYHAIMRKTDNYGGSQVKVGGVSQKVLTAAHLFFQSLATMKSPVLCDNGATSKLSSEVQRAIQLIQWTNSTMGPLPSNVLPVLTQDETYLPSGILPPTIARK